MEKHLGDLLKELNKRYPENPTVSELHNEKFTDNIIHEAKRRDLIIHPYDTLSYTSLGTSERVSLSTKGFELLNQIRMNEDIEQLDKSIKKFNDSSDRASNVLVILTILLAFIGYVTAIGVESQDEKNILTIIFLIFIVATIYYVKKKSK